MVYASRMRRAIMNKSAYLRAPIFQASVLPLNLTATCATPGLTLQFYQLTPTGTDITIDWGDGSALETIANGRTSNIDHVYATAATFAITITKPNFITRLLVSDTKIGCSAGELKKLTSVLTLNFYGNSTYLYAQAGEITSLINLTSLHVNGCQNIVISTGQMRLLTNLTYFQADNFPDITLAAGDLATLTNLTQLALNYHTKATVGAGEIGLLTKLTSLQIRVDSNIVFNGTDFGNLIKAEDIYLDGGYNQAKVDQVLAGIYAARANYTHSTPVLNIAGSHSPNAAPSGSYADEDPPTTGKGMIYELVNDPESEGFNKWAITYTA